MPEFHLIQTIQAPLPGPTKCFFCGDFTGPFINTNTESSGFGAVYICCPNERRSGCLDQMARLAGYVAVEQLIAMANQLEARQEEVVKIREELDELLQLKDISAIVRKRQERKLEPNGDNAPKRPRKSRRSDDIAAYLEAVTFTEGGEIGGRP